MAIDERSRRELYEALEAALGSEHADTAMALLPPAGWFDVATKQDLREHEQRATAEHAQLRTEIARVEGSVANLRADVADGFRTQTYRFYGALFLVLATLVPLIVAYR
jgi:hypothetical protein